MTLASVLFAPSWVCGESLDTHSFELASSGDHFVLRHAEYPPILVPKEWLVPPQELEKEEASRYVSSFDYSEDVTAFRATAELIGLHLSSYQIQQGGSAGAAAGRDVFLLYDPQKEELTTGQLNLGLTKGRIRFMGCTGAHHHRFAIEDINGDQRTDLGVKKEEILCKPVYHEAEDVDYYVGDEASHAWQWFVLEENRWVHSTAHEGRTPGAGALELPLIDLVKSPVDFVREMKSTGNR